MSGELAAAVIGGLIGGVLGVVGTLVSSYYGPRKIEEWREKRLDERLNGPRKRPLLKMLEDTRFNDGRKIEPKVAPKVKTILGPPTWLALGATFCGGSLSPSFIEDGERKSKWSPLRTIEDGLAIGKPASRIERRTILGLERINLYRKVKALGITQ